MPIIAALSSILLIADGTSKATAQELPLGLIRCCEDKHCPPPLKEILKPRAVKCSRLNVPPCHMPHKLLHVHISVHSVLWALEFTSSFHLPSTVIIKRIKFLFHSQPCPLLSSKAVVLHSIDSHHRHTRTLSENLTKSQTLSTERLKSGFAFN